MLMSYLIIITKWRPIATLILFITFSPLYAATIEKALLYDRHTLPDHYAYQHSERQFQWDKINAFLDKIDKQSQTTQWGTLQNYKNQHGTAALVKEHHLDAYHNVSDRYGTERSQSIALYNESDLSRPERYAFDGSLVKIIEPLGEFTKIETMFDNTRWVVANRYLRPLDNLVTFYHVIMVDRTNQNISTIEKQANKWFIRSMNPATTGRYRPPYGMITPKGIFVLQEKKRKMFYFHDGKSTIAGYAPYANRFSAGGYIHGVPLRGENHQEVEFSQTLGSIPLSHKCIRNATSHAKFIYDWAPSLQTLVFIYD